MKVKVSDIPDGEIVECCLQRKSPFDELAHKYPAKVIERKMEKLVDKGVLDYGVSLRTAFVKDQGKHE